MRFWDPIPAKWLVKQLEIRALERPMKQNHILCTIHETVNRIMRQRGEEDERARLACVSSICLCMATWRGFRTSVIDDLIEIEPYNPDETLMMRGCLAAAAWMGDSQFVEAFSRVDDINEDADDFPPPLWAAARQGNVEIVQQLLHKGARVTSSNDDSTTYQAACWSGNEEIVRLLIETNPKIEQEDLEKGLCRAVSGNHVELIRFLLERFEFKDIAKSVALHDACFYGAEEAARLMLDRGVSTEYYDLMRRRHQPLATASKYGHLAIVRLLVSKGVDLNFLRGYWHPDAVLLAATRGYVRTVEVLLDAGARLMSTMEETLERVVERGHEDMARLLLNRGYPIHDGFQYDRKEGGRGRYILAHACEQGQASMVRLLAEYGVDIHNPGNYRGEELPIIRAKKSGHHNVVNTLLKLGVQKPEELDSIEGDKDPFPLL